MIRIVFVLFLVSLVLFSCKENIDSQPILSASLDEVEKLKVNIDTLHAAFDSRLQETSGLIKIGDSFWTNNDSGGEPRLYNFDLNTGDIIRSVLIKGVKNIDWEAVTADSTHFYIGDFGNNLGKRENLMVYKGLISDLNQYDEVEIEKIKFTYADQLKLYNGYDHNHDCEAMITYGDYIILFSKNWLNRKCKMYALPKEAGSYKLEVKAEFDSRGTITGADISPAQDEIILLGYTPIPRKGFDPFVWKLRDWEGDNLFSAEMRRYDFYTRRQMEGVTYLDSRTIIISAEDENGTDPSLFRMNL